MTYIAGRRGQPEPFVILTENKVHLHCPTCKGCSVTLAKVSSEVILFEATAGQPAL